VQRSLPEPVSFARVSAAFREGRGTPRAFLEQCLAAVKQYDKTIEAFVTFDERAARKSRRRGDAPLQGGPTALPC
jgi:Asp-tRNA(Asn)/Glu-tRNA(Gln) amidotransferase A subunit family amidase